MDFSEKTQPNDMLVEITNRCNYQCNFCTHSEMKPHFGDINPVFLRRILQEAYDMGVRRVGLYTIGEMFLCNDIVTHIKNAKEIGYEYIYSDTNGALASEQKIEAVIVAGLDSIKFSINAGTAETYKKIHGHDAFGTVLKNLKRTILKLDCLIDKTMLTKKLKHMKKNIQQENLQEVKLLKEQKLLLKQLV
jgi:molybdenum cofactor biosynthesis enzyme MoaA